MKPETATGETLKPVNVRLRLSDDKTTSKLAATRAAGADRLARLERAAHASGRLRPLAILLRRIGRHELIDRGAALTYYSVLSLVPGLVIVFSLIGLFGSQHTVESVLSIIRDVGPSSGDQTARQPLESLLKEDAESSALLGAGLIAILWTASAYVGCFFRASATIWDVPRRPAWRAWPLRMALTIGFLILLATALLLIVLTGQLAHSIADAVGIGNLVLDLYAFLKWPALSPSSERSVTKWRLLTPGGAAAVAAWLLVSAAFEVYANVFASYDSTYGALGTTVAGLVWIWLMNLTLLVGVELDAALESSVRTTLRET